MYLQGRIEAQGTFDELSRANTDFTKMLIAADETIEDAVPDENIKANGIARQESVMSVSVNAFFFNTFEEITFQ